MTELIDRLTKKSLTTGRLFGPIHWLGHPEKYVFLLQAWFLIGSKYTRKNVFDLDNNGYATRTHTLRANAKQGRCKSVFLFSKLNLIFLWNLQVTFDTMVDPGVRLALKYHHPAERRSGRSAIIVRQLPKNRDKGCFLPGTKMTNKNSQTYPFSTNSSPVYSICALLSHDGVVWPK